MIDLNTTYKRIFAFGCSYTRYYYPTWANIIASQYSPDTQFINLGVSGGGNSLVLTRLSQADSKFKIQKNDLVLIMYPSFTREDRFVSEGYWHTPGNIFNSNNNGAHPDAVKFYKSHGCYLHYLIRDMSYIYMIESYLSKLECDKLTLISANFTDIENGIPNTSSSVLVEDVNQTRFQNLLETYDSLLRKFPISYHEYLYKNYVALNKPTGVTLGNERDSHPTPLESIEYLKHIGLSLNQSALDFAEIHNKIIFSCKSLSQIINVYQDMQNRQDYFQLINGII